MENPHINLPSRGRSKKKKTSQFAPKALSRIDDEEIIYEFCTAPYNMKTAPYCTLRRPASAYINSRFVNGQNTVKPSDSSPSTPRSGKEDKWKKLKNVLLAIKLMKTPPVKKLDPHHIIQEINSTASRRHSISTVNRNSYTFDTIMNHHPMVGALDDFRRQKLFFSHIERGGKSDLEKMEKLLINDPRKNLLEVSDVDHLLNRKNQNGQTPLYIACQNGNINVVKFLIQQGANIHINSMQDQIMESNLEVSSRWGYSDLVEILLGSQKFEKKVLDSAIAVSTSKVKKILVSYKKDNFGKPGIFCSCFPSKKTKKSGKKECKVTPATELYLSRALQTNFGRI